LANAGVIVESRTSITVFWSKIWSHTGLEKSPRLTQKMKQARYQWAVAYSKLDIRELVQSKIPDKD